MANWKKIAKITFIILFILSLLANLFLYFAWDASFRGMQRDYCRAVCCEIGYSEHELKDRYCYCSFPENPQYPNKVIYDNNANIFDAETMEWLNNPALPLEYRLFISKEELKNISGK